MKKLSFTLLSVTLALSASAQLSTYNYADAAGQLSGSTVLKIDTFHNIQVNGGGVPSFAPGMNATWDLSGAIYQNGISELEYDTSTAVVFAPAEYSNEVTYNITLGVDYVSNLKFEISPTGIVSYGEHIDQQVYQIGLLTGTPGDELVLLTQDVVYSSPITSIPFPCVSGSAPWNATLSYETNMELDYTTLGYSGALIVRKTHVTRTDEAVGYGTMEIMRPDNLPGLPIEVIQLKSVMMLKDSFFYNGMPLPSNVLTTFSLTQGQENYVYQHTFYRAGEVTPFVNVSYDDNGFTNIHDITVHAQRVPVNVGVNDIKKDNRVAIYPNPATSFVNVAVKDKTVSNCHYELMNIGGQVVANGSVTLAGGEAQISLANTPAGMYFIRLSNNSEVIGESVLSVIK